MVAIDYRETLERLLLGPIICLYNIAMHLRLFFVLGHHIQSHPSILHGYAPKSSVGSHYTFLGGTTGLGVGVLWDTSVLEVARD